MLIVKLLIGFLEKTPFSPVNLEQLSLFEQNNLVSGENLNFNYYNITPQNVISIIKNTL